MAAFNPAKYEIEIYLDKARPERLEQIVAACKEVWPDGGAAWKLDASDEPTSDHETILSGYGWLWSRTPQQLVNDLRTAVVGANERRCEVSIFYSQVRSLGERVVTYGPRGSRQEHELRDGQYRPVKDNS